MRLVGSKIRFSIICCIGIIGIINLYIIGVCSRCYHCFLIQCCSNLNLNNCTLVTCIRNCIQQSNTNGSYAFTIC